MEGIIRYTAKTANNLSIPIPTKINFQPNDAAITRPIGTPTISAALNPMRTVPIAPACFPGGASFAAIVLAAITKTPAPIVR
ncbi:hypothetical protein SAMN04487897_1224 [Paenibacillus sp. yr247]|nr:hypothetical protein SAMN04487897_1224 [Paenibacillus sp. yr247]